MRWFHIPVLAFLSGSLAACGGLSSGADVSQGDEPSTDNPTVAGQATPAQQSPLLDAASDVRTSPALAEALVLYDRSLSGTESKDFAGASFVHTPVVDFSDRPFEDLVFVTGVLPHPDGPYVSCEDGSLTVAVGATRAQMPVSWSRCGTDLQERIQLLTEKIGADQVEALVGADASTYLLRTTEGDYWDVGNGALLEPAQVADLRKRYDAAWAQAETNGTPDILHESWDSFDVSEEVIKSFTRDDGSLDLDLALQEISGPSILQQVEESATPFDPGPGASQLYSQWNGSCYGFWFFGWHELGCDKYEEGHHADPRRTQAHYPNQFSGFTMPSCTFGTATNVAGCGPAAFASLTDWLWRRGQPIPSAGFSHGNEPYSPGWNWAPRPNQLALYQQVETQAIGLMGSCSLGSSGTLTLPGAFFWGGNAWLAANAPGVTMNRVDGAFLVNRFLGDSFASVLRGQIGQDRGPVVAGFHIDGEGAFDYHYSPVARYFVERPYGWFTKTRIESIDGYSSYLTNPWSLYSGVYWLEGKIGGCRFGDERYAWSCNGPIPGYRKCVQVLEPSDPDTWTDNYFCYNDQKRDFAWSYAGPIGGMACTQILETADPHTWTDNYLCATAPGTSWTSSWNEGSNCFRWSEPSDPHTWDDNFLCTP